jgi:hypothetical protein
MSTTELPQKARLGVEFPLHRLAGAVSHARVTRRGLQIALGLFWLLDGALQFQPFMLRASFAREVLAPVGDGQPHWVAGPVHWAANVVAAHPVAWDVPFASIQVLLGLGMLVPRTAKLTLAASLPWLIAVWYLGEGLSGLAGGNASIISGAPGSVLLYALLALAAWPRGGRSDVAPPRWLPYAWATFWIGGAIYQALPPNNTGADLAGQITAFPGPSWLASVQNSLARFVTHHGVAAVVVVAAVEVLIGLAALRRTTLRLSAAAGLLALLAIWVIGQDFGQVYSGQATDPNTGAIAVLVAVALLFGYRRRGAPTAPAFREEAPRYRRL